MASAVGAEAAAEAADGDLDDVGVVGRRRPTPARSSSSLASTAPGRAASGGEQPGLGVGELDPVVADRARRCR